ncbi:MAG: hypothetical protein KCHDKBKB_02393 [Elusimicrobia bacterium]|nr:hypothetical protein [Elusimicrobiota bacterium]
MKGEIFEEALDREQPMIAGLRQVSSAGGFVFQILEEGQNGFDVELGDIHRPGFPALSLKILKQELKGVSVTFDGVGT